MSLGRIAIIHDWLESWRGGENVLAEIVRLQPQADLFALVDFLPDTLRPRLLGKRATTSFLQHLPGARRHFRAFAPLYPKAIESLDVSAYDTIISSSHAVAKGVRTRPGQMHVCYCHTPMRYAWDLREQYLAVTGLARGLRGILARRALDRLRDWDLASSVRVTHFIANSEYIRARILRCYGRTATVIYPPVDTLYYTPAANPPSTKSANYFFAASHWVPYKRMDLIVEAFRALPQHRLVVAGEGPEAARVRAAAGTNVEFVGQLTQEQLRDRLRETRALVFAAEEDFGILPVESQACGTPVIAYGRGGALETVRPPPASAPTGLLFPEQSAAAIAAAIVAFDAIAGTFTAVACRTNAEQYASARFRAEFARFMTEQNATRPGG